MDRYGKPVLGACPYNAKLATSAPSVYSVRRWLLAPPGLSKVRLRWTVLLPSRCSQTHTVSDVQPLPTSTDTLLFHRSTSAAETVRLDSGIDSGLMDYRSIDFKPRTKGANSVRKTSHEHDRDIIIIIIDSNSDILLLLI